jgi:pimeloyl-ACP methyl ester carboxylesterase
MTMQNPGADKVGRPAVPPRRKRRALMAFGVLSLLGGGVLSCVVATVPGPSASWRAMQKMPRTFVIDGLGHRVSTLQGGDPAAQRVIYVHGTPGDANAWADFVLDPVPGTYSIAMDRPGFGQSEPKGAVPSLHEQAIAIEPLLGLGGKDMPILVGHSLGGPIIARVAADYPDRVGGLVIVAGSLDPELEKVLMIQHVGELGPIRAILPRFLENTNRELMPLKGELEELKRLLPLIKCPVVIIHGTKDGLVPYSNVEFMKAHFPEGTIRHIESIEGGSHFVPWEHSDTIREAIKSLLAVPDESGR